MSVYRIDKNQIANVYLFHGEEAYKKRMYKEQLNEAVAGNNDMNYAYFEGDHINMDELGDSVMTLPFFAEKRLVIVENSGFFKEKQKGGEEKNSENREALIGILNELPETTCLAFFETVISRKLKSYKLIKEKGVAVECARDDEADVKKWLKKGFAAAGKEAEMPAIRILVERIGTDYDKLRGEYEKLIAYVGDKSVITKEDVLAIASEDVESKIFDMLKGMGRKDVRFVLSKYNDLLVNRASPLYILAMLRDQFRTLIQTAELRNKGYNTAEVARMCGKPEFAIRNAEGYLRGGFRMKDVRDILDEISETDKKIKTGDVGDRTGVEILLVRFSTR